MLRIVFVLGVLVVSPSFAVDIREFVDIKTPAVETIGNWIISEFASENLETGFDRIRKANIGINESDLLRIQNTFSSTNLNIVRAYGSVTGIDLISEMGISDGYVRLDY